MEENIPIRGCSQINSGKNPPFAIQYHHFPKPLITPLQPYQCMSYPLSLNNIKKIILKKYTRHTLRSCVHQILILFRIISPQ